MRLAERFGSLERFDARSVTWFLRAYGAAVVLDVVIEAIVGVWGVHTRQLYPWRHLGIVPLYPAWALAIEWALRAGAGVGLALGARRVRIVGLASKVAALVLFAAVLERYSNHGVLLFLIAFFLTIAPPDVTGATFEDVPHPALGLVRAQLAIVYVFTAINKAAHGFGGGESLVLLGARVGHALSEGAARAMSWGVIVVELALPLMLVVWPRAGFAGVVALHVVFAFFLPNVASFSLAMIAVAALFLGRPRAGG
jgi:hypothetical protein